MDRIRILAALAYIPGGFLLTHLAGERDDFHAFHVRQGAIVTILALIIVFAAAAIAILTPFFLGILVAFALDTMLALIMMTGALRAYQGRMWQVPVIGAYVNSVKA